MTDSSKYRRNKGGLTAEQAGEIKARLLLGEKTGAIAKAYGVTPASIRAIRIGRSWKEIQPTQAPKGDDDENQL